MRSYFPDCFFQITGQSSEPTGWEPNETCEWPEDFFPENQGFSSAFFQGRTAASRNNARQPGPQDKEKQDSCHNCQGQPKSYGIRIWVRMREQKWFGWLVAARAKSQGHQKEREENGRTKGRSEQKVQEDCGQEAKGTCQVKLSVYSDRDLVTKLEKRCSWYFRHSVLIGVVVSLPGNKLNKHEFCCPNIQILVWVLRLWETDLRLFFQPTHEQKVIF